MQTCGCHGLQSAAALNGCGGGSRMQATASRKQAPELTMVAMLQAALPTRHQRTLQQLLQAVTAGRAAQRLWERRWLPRPHLRQVCACCLLALVFPFRPACTQRRHDFSNPL